MNSKTWLRYIYAAAIAAILTIGTFGQVRSQITRPCAGSTTPASVQVRTAGDIYLTPCTSKSIFFGSVNLSNLINTSGQFYPAESSASGATAGIRFNNGDTAVNDTYIASDFGGRLLIGGGGYNPVWSIQGGLYVGHASNLPLAWSSTTSSIGTADVGIGRNSVGVLAVTDSSTGIKSLLGGGTAIASATALPLPTGNVFHVTGVTSITSITSTNFQSGVCITLIFDGILTLTDGGNIKAAGNFVTTADDTWSACYDGTNWYETARAVN